MLCREVNPWVSVAKASLNRAFEWHDPDPKRSDLSMARLEATVRRRGGPNPLQLKNGGDELWIGVKGQSNSVIAGSPRNAFRCSVTCFFAGGRATGWPMAHGLLTSAKPECR